AVRANKVDAFRKGYRRVELLCIDDVHFLSNKEATQTELLHTLDAIGFEGAKLAFASDESPREIRKLSEKLVSRFMSGVVARIDIPDPELREKLVRALAKRRGMRLEEPAVKLIADRSMRAIGSLGGFGGSVRELEGLVIQVEAVHRLLPEFASNGTIGVILVRKAFGLQESDSPIPIPLRSPRRPIAIEFVIEEVCRTLGVDFERLMGKGRHKRVVLARSLISYLARKLTTMSFPEIARAMGRPNHSTIITAQRRLEAELDRSPDTALGDELCPSFPTMTLRELTDRLSTQLQRGNQG
ncbi:MAG: DnaA ATPase domain-containing protein, partial [Phycisphaerales bacterium]